MPEGKSVLYTTDDRKAWTGALEGMPYRDIFYDRDYCALFEKYFKQKAFLYDFSSPAGRVVHVFFRRDINGLDFISGSARPFPEKMYDLVSPWYFGGILVRDDAGEDGRDVIKEYFNHFRDYCMKNGIVAEFMRLHPLALEGSQIKRISDLVQVEQFNDVVYIDLLQDEDTIWNKMKKQNREKIRKARNSEVRITETSGDEDITAFHKLYLEAMDRKKARDYYYFPLEFIKELVRTFPDDTKLMLARIDDKVIANILMLGKYDAVYSYLSASDPEYLSTGVNNLFKYEGALWGKRKGYKYCVFGGGNKINDGLFKFKASFSDTYKSFFVGKCIYDKKLYDDLCAEKMKQEARAGSGQVHSAFFPRYRLGE